MLRKPLIVLAAGIALLVNPNLACGPTEEEADFTYTESEMESAAVGTYVGSVTVDGAESPVTLVLERGSATDATQQQLQPQCGDRSFFIQPAAACASASHMALRAEVTSDATDVAGTFTGELMAYRILHGADLWLVRGVDGPAISASYDGEALVEWKLEMNGASIPMDLARQ